MNTDKQLRLVFSGLILLVMINFVALFLVFRNSSINETRTLEKIQLRMDTLSIKIEASQQQIDTVIRNIRKTLDLSRQLDEQIIDLSTGYEKDKAKAHKNLQNLKEQIQKENEQLQLLQHELKQL